VIHSLCLPNIPLKNAPITFVDDHVHSQTGEQTNSGENIIPNHRKSLCIA